MVRMAMRCALTFLALWAALELLKVTVGDAVTWALALIVLLYLTIKSRDEAC